MTDGHDGVVALVREFLPLNARRTHGGPPLTVEELERWSDLRSLLEQVLGFAPPHSPPPQPGVAPRALRVPSHVKVRYMLGSDLEVTKAADISEGGLFLATQRPLAPGTPLRLEIDGSHGSLRLDGVVRWIRECAGAAGPAGMGIRFEELSDTAHDALSALVESELSKL